MNDYIRHRIQSLIRSKPGSKMVRSTLIKQFGPSLRSRANHQIDTLIQGGVLKTSAPGSRGNPETLSMDKNFPIRLCPLCSRSMPDGVSVKSDELSLDLIDMVSRADNQGIRRRDLFRIFNPLVGEEVNNQISLLLSNGNFVKTGRGVRGDPEAIHINRSQDRCLFCLKS